MPVVQNIRQVKAQEIGQVGAIGAKGKARRIAGAERVGGAGDALGHGAATGFADRGDELAITALVGGAPSVAHDAHGVVGAGGEGK